MKFWDSAPTGQEPARPALPPWVGPGDELGTALPTRIFLVRTSEMAIMVSDVVAFSNGFELQVGIRTRTQDLEDLGSLLHRPFRPGEPVPEDIFRFGIELSDGRRATSTSMGGGPQSQAYFRAIQEGREPEIPAGPLMMQRGGGGGARGWNMRYWVWPLPPPGPVKVACEWQHHAIPLTFAKIDGGLIREAGAASEILWPEVGPAHGGWSATVLGE